MANYIEQVSLRLYRTLEDVGLSEEMRRFHRQNVTGEIIATALMYLTTGEGERYHFGSSSEGTTTVDMESDIDNVIVETFLPIVTNVRDATEGGNLLMIWDGPTFNDYVKLQFVERGIPINGNFNFIPGFKPDAENRLCLKTKRDSSKLNHHGPAHELPVPGLIKPIDLVFSLKCINVPDVATSWLRRPRKFGWPSQQCIDRMTSMPHFLVAVGHPFSRERDIEWRLSYSLHERELMFSLNTTQHQCYGFMKMVKKNILEPEVGEECISSYHCKTVLFWVIEDTPAEFWRPNNIVECIFRCLMKMQGFLLSRNCPNFFNMASNLFERQVFSRQKDRLQNVISQILDNFLEVITQITCSNVNDIFLSRRVPHRIKSAKVMQKFHCNMPLVAILQSINKQIAHIAHGHESILDCIDKFADLLNVFSSVENTTEHTEEQTEAARQFLLPCIHFRLATNLAAQGFRFNRGPLRYSYLRRSLHHVNESRGRDLVTSRLIHVTILYKLRQFMQCESILQQIEEDLKPYVYSFCKCYEHPYKLDAKLIQWQEQENVTGRLMLESGIATCLSFLPSEMEIVPEPLSYKVGRSRDYPNLTAPDYLGHRIGDWAIVDGKVYFYLMKYLVCTQLEQQVLAASAKDSIKCVIDTEPDIAHKNTAYNILGWLYLKEQNQREAIRYWRMSFEEQPFDNVNFRHVRSLLD